MQIFSYLALMTSLLILSTANAACVDCSSVDFDKQIELNLIKPMLQMSTKEKIAYVQSFGIEVFRVKDPDNLPVTLAFIAEADPHLIPQKFLKLFSEGAVGLYMTPTNFSYTVKKPTILLADSADDWSIVHEFSHFLFDRARLLEDSTRESTFVMNSEDAQEDFFEARDVYKNLGEYRNQQHKERTIQSFITYAHVQMIFSKTCELEETTIEKILRDFYTKEKPFGFKPEHFERSSRYIKSTSQKGQDNLNLLLEICSDLQKTLTEEDRDLSQKLTATCLEASTLKKQALRVYQKLKID